MATLPGGLEFPPPDPTARAALVIVLGALVGLFLLGKLAR